MKKVIIIHFRSVKDYPPVINAARYLASRNMLVTIFSGSHSRSPFSFQQKGITLRQFFFKSGLPILEYARYGWFYVAAFLELVKTRNTPILYYESISALPVWFYFLIFRNSKRPLFIHYHEYFTKAEYAGQTLLERVGRKVEPLLFRRAVWISHTNTERMTFHQQDFPRLQAQQLQVLPNYPSSQWLATSSRTVDYEKTPFKIVYVGSLSLTGTYIREVLEWVKAQAGNVVCDIYCQNATAEILELLGSQPQALISFKGTIPYDALPKVLPNYHAGLVLYTGAYTNFIYNAPNKIFEYLACGLDVWCPDVLISSKPYQQRDAYPKMIMVDFARLATFDYRQALSRAGLPFRPSPYTMESVYEKLYQKLIQC